MATTTIADTLEVLAQRGDLAQLAIASDGVPNQPDLLMEPKMDGWRILAHVTADGVQLYARSGKRYDAQLPGVSADLAAHLPPGTWIDGEAVALTVNEDGTVTNDWGKAQSVMTKIGGHAAAEKVTFMAFDLIAHGGHDARPLPFAQRRRLLERIFEDADFQRCALSATMKATEDNYERLVTMGFEGAMVKSLGAPYASAGRGAGWFKVKHVSTVEAQIIGFVPGKNGLTGSVGAVRFAMLGADEVLHEVGTCAGMSDRTRLHMKNHPEEWLGRVIEIAHMGVSANQRLRHPQMKRVRDDIKPEWCSMRQIQSQPSATSPTN